MLLSILILKSQATDEFSKRSSNFFEHYDPSTFPEYNDWENYIDFDAKADRYNKYLVPHQNPQVLKSRQDFEDVSINIFTIYFDSEIITIFLLYKAGIAFGILGSIAAIALAYFDIQSQLNSIRNDISSIQSNARSLTTRVSSVDSRVSTVDSRASCLNMKVSYFCWIVW